MNLKNLLQSESFGGAILITCVAGSLLIANSALGDGFQSLLSYTVGPDFLKLNLLEWINDGLMAIFFFFIGLEIKQEVLNGHLSSFKKAAVPVFAAVGGALLPALVFYLLNRHTLTAKGWGIPMATDIAFALGILSLLGKRVSPVLKAFLSTLAVADDLLAILVIAVFYGGSLHWAYLFGGLAVFLFLFLLNKLGVTHLLFYIIPGIVLWYFIHHSGVHATIAGVLVAITIPHRSTKGSPLRRLAHSLAIPVNFLIMPLFAIANTNIRFSSEMVGGATGRLSIGIIAGLIIGKPIGVLLTSWLSVKLKLGVLPAGLSWQLLGGVGLLAGIGFTMSIFISVLSFGATPLSSEAKFAVLIASALSGLVGYVYLRKVSVAAR